MSIFLRKIVKMFTINYILHEFRFFVTVFLRKIVKTGTFSRKIVKTGFNLANVVFFVKVKTDNAPSCSSGSPDPERFERRCSQTTKVQTDNALPSCDPDLFEIGRSQTTNEEMSFRFCYLQCKRLTPLPVVQDRQILNGLRSGDLKLQMGITEFGTGMSLLLGCSGEKPGRRAL